MVIGAAKECYSCSGAECEDPFDPNRQGVGKNLSSTGWCIVHNLF